jgi:hypothetical protein
MPKGVYKRTKEFGQKISEIMKGGNLGSFKKGHKPIKGAGFKKGKQNPAWKGENVKYGSLHDYIKYYLPKPERCQNCNEIKKLDLANISGKYKRDLMDWEWLCRKCHMIKDGRIEKFISYHLKPWNKEKKGVMPIPWNKGLKYRLPFRKEKG